MEVIAMSKIATLEFKNKNIDIWIREKLGKHKSPYIVITLPDKSEAHMTLEDRKVFDNSIEGMDTINFVKKWVIAYYKELLDAWNAAKNGKALIVPSEMPRKKEIKSFKVKKIKDLKTTDDLKMIICFEDNETRIVDFKHDVIPKNAAFKILTDPDVFRSAKAQNSAVLWENVDIDIEAADLYDISVPEVGVSYCKRIEALKK
jgi:hypothetical protein